jgi:hypothetical protein
MFERLTISVSYSRVNYSLSASFPVQGLLRTATNPNPSIASEIFLNLLVLWLIY